MSLPVFLLASTTGALIWNTFLTLAGYILHEHYEMIEVVLDPLSYIVLGLVVVLYLLKVATWKPSQAKA
jgi:membrane protein DedA with SNARE-associated domain